MNTKFRCFSCDYYRDLEKPKTQKAKSPLDGQFIAFMVFVILVWVMLFAR
ncbi:MAG: hypothetical protein F6K65_41455 [Moorea sp. SIO3C2]|nr:hypothetical protein [Moorena sp. SIO3C2]